jgi:hypothetical protein
MSGLSHVWKKSSRSTPQGGNCVEVRRAEHGDIQVRDSKDPGGSVLTFSPEDWHTFINRAKTRQFDI